MTWFSWGVAGQGLSQLCFRRARGNDSKRERLSLSSRLRVAWEAAVAYWVW
jgi:hypothetical protein